MLLLDGWALPLGGHGPEAGEGKTVGGLSEEQKARIKGAWHGEILWNCPMSEHTTFRVGGPADALAFPKNTGELAGLVRLLNEERVPHQVIGRGSNILVSDSGVGGVTIVLGKKFARLEELAAGPKEIRLRAGAGCSLAGLLAWCVEQSAAGLEFLAGIPGTVGGALMMNAGAWQAEIGDRVAAIECLDRAGEVFLLERRDLDFTYRRLRLEPETVITAGIFRLTPGGREMIEETMTKFVAERKKKQPAAVASAGSFFKNPPGRAAGRLIQDAGLKGTRIGGAEVSAKHANFIVNTGNATARDIYELMLLVQTKVLDATGIRLEPEVRFMGRFDSAARRQGEG